MQIIDKYGYLGSALDYIEKRLMSGRGLQQLAIKAGIKEGLVRNLSAGLEGFSEKHFLSLLSDKIEERHSSTPGADAEISGTDISIESQNYRGGAVRAFILMNIICEIVVDGEQEDKIKISAKIFSKNNINLNAS